jgi:beta-phosphoglucomutase-like phosphatase (HAD superfamily)
MTDFIEIHPDAKALIFDLDGTIADTMPIHYTAWKNAAARYGIDFTVELFAQLAGFRCTRLLKNSTNCSERISTHAKWAMPRKKNSKPI